MGDVDRGSQARQIEHQSSLRSLLSGSEGSSAEMQEGILRQITDEGLLDGIDLNNMNIAQVDELSNDQGRKMRKSTAATSPGKVFGYDRPGNAFVSFPSIETTLARSPSC
ncbi:MAG: RING finger domain-containing [Lasallia pustulata]|uniref:RING finger domain-containing n=1 Tax=Lasallia pustulata TaxID=136370 RepID=A0A5M8PUM0_9LECA|nr:MAG: RING finger domain-containing [Lasallia pustulata]